MIRTLSLLPLLSVGCIFSVDTDDDGLTNREEKQLGTDIEIPDSDGDGILDGEEVNTTLTDPTLDDTDGDGYLDGDEVAEDSDPNDADSVIYKGGWPYFSDKDDIQGQNNGSFEVGRRLLRMSEMVDQYGDQVDLFDFYNEEGKPIVVDISAPWCPPCNEVSAWLDGDDSRAPWMAPYTAVREAVDNGDAYWITIMGEQADRSNAVRRTAREWYNEYPHPMVPVLADNSREHESYSGLGAWPWMYVLNGELKVREASGGQIESMQAIIDILDANAE